jgi:hypothetical protein
LRAASRFSCSACLASGAHISQYAIPHGMSFLHRGQGFRVMHIRLLSGIKKAPVLRMSFSMMKLKRKFADNQQSVVIMHKYRLYFSMRIMHTNFA